jgi:tRNA (guanine37-N1)-methyltransferase
VHFDVISLFPEMVATIAEFGVVGRAQRRDLITLDFENPRDHTSDVHRTVDDRPYGGGPGMVMKYEPLAGAVQAARERSPEGSPVVYLSPQGRVFNQATAQRYAALPGLILLAGRYEGVDERLIESQVDEELSVGDFVLSGGEVPRLRTPSWRGCWITRITRGPSLSTVATCRTCCCPVITQRLRGGGRSRHWVEAICDARTWLKNWN